MKRLIAIRARVSALGIQAIHFLLAVTALLVPAFAQDPVSAPPASPTASTAIPLDQLGTAAQKQYSGDGIGITPTANGARLEALFQRLEAKATPEGLWLTSTAEADSGKDTSFRVRAMAIERGGDFQSPLPPTGEVSATKEAAAWLRPNLIEEYRTSMDGIRQDFIVPIRPAGTGDLTLSLELTGAHAEPATDGAKLIVTASGRELAYNRLHVTDSTGRELTAHMEVRDAGTLAIRVEDQGATYPVRIDPTFSDADWTSMGGVPGASGTVRALAVHSSGNLYAGGDFTIVGNVIANYVAKWNGSAWSALGSGTNAGVLALALDGSGNLYAGGEFTTAGGAPANYVAKWNGSAWSALGSGTNEVVSALALDGSGSLYAGGSFTTAGGTTTNGVAKWNGSAWSALGSGTNAGVLALALDGSGNLYAGGYFTAAGGTTANRVAKWNGSAWIALGSGTNTHVNALALDGSGNLYACGSFTTAGGTAANRVAKWNGSAWSALGSGTNSYVNALALDGSGNLYAGGSFTTAGGTAATCVAKWNGSAWSALGSGTNGMVFALAQDGSGNLYAGGEFTTAGGGGGANCIAKWDGSDWSALGTGMNNFVNALAFDGAGNLYAGGEFTTAGGGGAANYIAKWDGSDWNALGTGVDSSVRALVLDGSGNLYAGGAFTNAGGTTANYVAKWNGSAWSALGSGTNGDVNALAQDGSGNLYAGGSFTTAGGTAANYVAKWNGSAWSGLGSGTNEVVSALAQDGSGNLYAGGYFTTAGGTTANYVAKWNGSAWSGLGSGTNGGVLVLALDGSGNLYAGGGFSSAGGVVATRIAKWNGSAWSALGAGINGGLVQALALDSSGNLYAGGWFSTAGGMAVNYVAKWNGSAWSALGSGTNGGVSALVLDSSNNFYAGGEFTMVGGIVSAYAAKFNLAESAIVLSGNGIGITNGDLTPGSADGTDFGSIPVVSGSVVRSFTITNTGAGTLDLLDPAPNYLTLSGDGAAAFSVSTQPSAATIAPNGGTRTFAITFDSSASGTQSATVSIANDDSTKNPFTFAIQGIGALTTFNAGTEVPITANGYTASGALGLALGFAPSPGQVLTLVNNTSGSPISGTFTGLPQGATVPITYSGNTYHFTISYTGGDGNDITLALLAPVFTNGSFENPIVGPPGSYGSFVYRPAGSDWVFAETAGVAANGSGFAIWGHPAAPSGNQFAFLQSLGGSGGEMTQTQTLQGGYLYSLSFYVSQRDISGRDNTNPQAIRVSVGSTPLGTYTPASTAWTQISVPFRVPASGTMNLTFQAANSGGDSTVLIDAVTVELLAVPPVVTNLTAAQRAGTKLVDITYDLAAPGFPAVAVSLAISSDSGSTWTVPVVSATGDTGSGVAPGTGKAIVWNAGTDFPQSYSSQIRFRVTAEDGFARIPAGSFTMGRTSGDTDADAPPVTVTLSEFYLQKTETTKAQWDAVRTWGLSNGYTDLAAGSGKAPNHPVQFVSWWDVVKWCNARSEKEGLTPCYTVSGAVLKTGTTLPTVNWSANGYRLPTEAEWEKAARGGVSGKRFPWGTDTISHADANFVNNGGESYQSGTAGYHPSFATSGFPYTSPVGSFPDNGYGLTDMAGNVWEWCWDWYGSSYYTTGTTDPRGPSSGSNRVMRGGSWDSGASDHRCSRRHLFNPAGQDTVMGFRPARSRLLSEFAEIPGGSFTMGRTSGDTDTDAPPVNVTVSKFYLQRTETTKAQWDEVRAWGLSNGYTDIAVGAGKAANHPVQTVSWWDAVKWCNARSEKEGLTPVYATVSGWLKTGTTVPTVNWSSNGYRLPTEAEWEKAARGGVSGKRFPWGTDTISHAQANYFGSSAYAFDQSPINNHHPTYATGGTPYTSPVGSFAANGYGLYDMSGNVFEWSWDWYGSSYYTTSAGTTNPPGPSSGSSRVFRGGSWDLNATYERCASRHTETPGYAFVNIGFRPARGGL